ncbi:hypothetical protein Hanom_Chr02g00167841 [Helianthus anomalus]
METGWILLPDTSPTLETFRKRPRRVPMVFPSPTSTRDGYGHINGVTQQSGQRPISACILLSFGYQCHHMMCD